MIEQTKYVAFFLLGFLPLSSFASFSVYFPLENNHGGHLPNNTIIIGENTPPVSEVPDNLVCNYSSNDYFLVIDFQWNSSSFYYPYQDRVVWNGQNLAQPYRSKHQIPEYLIDGYEYSVLGEAKQINDYSSSGNGRWIYYEICRKESLE